MNKSIVSLSQEWQSYQLPEWHLGKAAPIYSQSINQILELVDELASVRAYLRLIDQRREQLAKQALRWDVSHDPTNTEFCWNCYFFNHSFNPDDASQIIKTLKTCFYKETYELREEAGVSSSRLSLLENSSILQRVMRLKGGVLNWKLSLGFSADLGDILKAIRHVIDSRIFSCSNETFNNLLDDMEIFFKPVISIHNLAEAPRRSPIAQDVMRRCEEIVLKPCSIRFGEFVKTRMEEDRKEILNLITAHYQRIEVNLSDYLGQFKIYEPDQEILIIIKKHRSAHQAWVERRNLWSQYLTDSSVWPIDDLINQTIAENIDQAQEVLSSQLRTLERIRRRGLNKDNVISGICDLDRQFWLEKLTDDH